VQTDIEGNIQLREAKFNGILDVSPSACREVSLHQIPASAIQYRNYYQPC